MKVSFNNSSFNHRLCIIFAHNLCKYCFIFFAFTGKESYWDITAHKSGRSVPIFIDNKGKIPGKL